MSKFYKKLHEIFSVHKRKVTIAAWCLIISISILYLFYFIHSKNYLRNPDTFYYLSIAENYLNNGTFLDNTTVPNGPVITPQNGIVGVFSILLALSFTKNQCLLIVVCLNYILFLSCFFPLTQICKKIGLKSKALLFCVFFLFISNLNIFMWLYMSPLNDMFFYMSQLWMLYFLIKMADYYYQEENPDGPCFSLIASIFLAAVMIHFRINLLFIPTAGILSALLVRKYKLVLPMIVLLTVMILSLSASFLIVDKYDFHNNTLNTARLITDFQVQIDRFLFRILPGGLFQNLGRQGNLLYSPFLLALLICFIHGIQKQNHLIVTITLVCVMTFSLIILHGNVTPRYLWPITIFMYIFLLRIKSFRAIGLLFVAVVIINNILPFNTLLSRWKQTSTQILAWEQISKQPLLSKDKFIMLSEYNRRCWYFTGIRSVYENKYTWDDLANAQIIFVIGTSDYTEEQILSIHNIAKLHNYESYVRPINYGIDYPDILFYEMNVCPSAQSHVLPCLPDEPFKSGSLY